MTIETIIERFWNDVAGLPWKDPLWVNNKAQVELSKQHFVKHTVEDLKKIMEDKNVED